MRDYNAKRRLLKIGSDPYSLLHRVEGGRLSEPEAPQNLPPPAGEFEAAAEPMPVSSSSAAAEESEPEPAPQQEEQANDPPLCDCCLDQASESGAPFATHEAA